MTQETPDENISLLMQHETTIVIVHDEDIIIVDISMATICVSLFLIIFFTFETCLTLSILKRTSFHQMLEDFDGVITTSNRDMETIFTVTHDSGPWNIKWIFFIYYLWQFTNHCSFFFVRLCIYLYIWVLIWLFIELSTFQFNQRFIFKQDYFSTWQCLFQLK